MSLQKYVIPALLLLTVLLIYRNLYFTMPDPSGINYTLTTQQPSPTREQTPESVAEKPEPKRVQSQKGSITINNELTKKMITYKYFVSYSPTKFDLYANGVHLVTLDKKHRPISTNLNKVPLKDGKLVVLYEYEFMGGSRKGAKEITFDVAPDADVLNLTFNWRDKWRVILDNATPISVERIEK